MVIIRAAVVQGGADTPVDERPANEHRAELAMKTCVQLASSPLTAGQRQ
jgi:hypothetical protein